MTEKEFPPFGIEKFNNEWAVFIKRTWDEEPRYDVISNGKTKEEALVKAFSALLSTYENAKQLLENINELIWNERSCSIQDKFEVPIVEIDFTQEEIDLITENWCEDQIEQCGIPKNSSCVYLDEEVFIHVFE